jgi:hypothetical protein
MKIAFGRTGRFGSGGRIWGAFLIAQGDAETRDCLTDCQTIVYRMQGMVGGAE